MNNNKRKKFEKMLKNMYPTKDPSIFQHYHPFSAAVIDLKSQSVKNITAIATSATRIVAKELNLNVNFEQKQALNPNFAKEEFYFDNVTQSINGYERFDDGFIEKNGSKCIVSFFFKPKQLGDGEAYIAFKDRATGEMYFPQDKVILMKFDINTGEPIDDGSDMDMGQTVVDALKSTAKENMLGLEGVRNLSKDKALDDGKN